MMMWIVLKKDVVFCELEDIVPVRGLNCLRTVVDTQLAVDFFDVEAYGIQGNKQTLGNFLIFQPLGHQPQYIPFPVR